VPRCGKERVVEMVIYSITGINIATMRSYLWANLDDAVVMLTKINTNRRIEKIQGDGNCLF